MKRETFTTSLHDQKRCTRVDGVTCVPACSVSKYILSVQEIDDEEEEEGIYDLPPGKGNGRTH